MQLYIEFCRKVLHRILPKNRFGDRIYSFLNFVLRHHGRIPRNRRLFNDYMYNLKTSKEISDPLRVYITDKELGKLYIKKILGDEFNIPTIKVLNNIEDVLKFNFPSVCVIKPTHLSGHVILKKKEDTVDVGKIKKWFSMNFYERSREANYKTLKPKVIVEEMVFSNKNAWDYKFFCFKGVPKLIQIDHDRYINHTLSLYTPDWTRQNFSITFDQYKEKVDKPQNLEEMLEAAKKIAMSTNLEFIRIDTYSDNNKFYIGELTNLHGNAAEIFYPSTGEEEASKIIFN